MLVTAVNYHDDNLLRFIIKLRLECINDQKCLGVDLGPVYRKRIKFNFRLTQITKNSYLIN
jgi:hypothetical protein